MGEHITASELFLQALSDFGVEYLFCNWGTDYPPLLEALAKLATSQGNLPQVIICPHENVAMSAAHGYAQVTGKTPAVLVHVDVGTANLTGAAHNAFRCQIPVLVFAGKTPYLTDGATLGSRSEYIQYLQDIYDQKSIIRPYVKWEYEIVKPQSIGNIVLRALEMANYGPKGPVYLIAAREILAERVEQRASYWRSLVDCSYRASDATLMTVARVLSQAKLPAIVTSKLGSNIKNTQLLTEFSELLAAPVVEVNPVYCNYNRTAALHLGFEVDALLDADVLLVIECDVPWSARYSSRFREKTIIHLGLDPLLSNIPVWDFPVHYLLRGDPGQTLACLIKELSSQDADAMAIEERSNYWTARSRQQRENWNRKASSATTITGEWLSASLNQLLFTEPAVIINEAITNSLNVCKYLTGVKLGSYFSSGGSHLGWGLGAALGAKLVLPGQRVVAIVGDGAMMFGVPTAALWMAQRYKLPVLIIIYNNGAWRAVNRATNSQYPDGYYAQAAGSLARLEPRLDFWQLARSVQGFGACVQHQSELEPAVNQAMAALNQGKVAIIDVYLEEEA